MGKATNAGGLSTVKRDLSVGDALVWMEVELDGIKRLAAEDGLYEIVPYKPWKDSTQPTYFLYVDNHMEGGRFDSLEAALAYADKIRRNSSDSSNSCARKAVR